MYNNKLSSNYLEDSNQVIRLNKSKNDLFKIPL